MKFFKLGLVLSVAGLFAFSCSQTPPVTNTTNTITVNQNGTTVSYEPAASDANQAANSTDELAGIKKIYTEKCVKCHKVNGEGGETDLDGKKIRVPSFKNEKIAALDDAKYKRVIEEGDDAMPGFKKELKPEEIAGLIKFIRKDFQGK